MKPEWRSILELRSVKDKIGVALDDLSDPDDAPIIAELIREGIMVWIDRTMLPIAVVTRYGTRVGIDTDVYQLTLKGIKLCNDNGIEQR